MAETIERAERAAENGGGLAKAYDPAATETGMYDRWDAAGYFAPSDGPETPFVLVMPPPNLTGELHIGHALFVTIQDVMARWHRMLGEPTLWLPGADHAGIAGQWVVEKELAAEGLTRHDLGREAFLERTWAYMDRYRGRTREQLRLLGASCDWSRFAFTMDPGPSRAVRHAFKRYYDRGLIYRGERIISWCPRCRTAISDLEVVHRDEQSSLWHLAYPVEGDGDERIVVATTRPETMLGDTGVAVHPDDDRYRHLIGRTVRLPIVDRAIPIVADTAVDPAFGTGAVKVTPAHDPNDFEIGKRAGLPALIVMHFDGTMNEAAGPFAGDTIAAARRGVIERFNALGLLIGTEPHAHAVGHCSRCDTVIQPLISKQWFVRMAPLAGPAIEVARDGRLGFVPERFKGVYLNWLENIHDWCISRQLWWGHRIPVYVCDDCEEETATVEETLAACPACGGAVTQDPDVLDTWFSSGLWPFSTLGWPDQTEDLRRFYPGTVMETGYEIIFLWVSRMVFFGLDIMGEIPFQTVYLHGMVRDAEGVKMSKTKGNVIDPTEIAAEYGADALRFALITQGSPGNDSRLSIPRVEAARNFVNKLWNATRFSLRAIADGAVTMGPDGPERPGNGLALVDRWILSRLDAVTADATKLLANHLYGEAGRQVQDFVWSELCDWYIEAAKVRLGGTPAERRTVAQTLAFTLERSARLLHPFMPFATEAIWRALPHVGESAMVAPWPEAGERDQTAEADVAAMTTLVTAIRDARAKAGVEPGRWIVATIYAAGRGGSFAAARREIGFLARIADEQLTIAGGAADPATLATDALLVVAGDVAAALPRAGLLDLATERDRLTRELAEAEAERERAIRQLDNPAFVDKAPAQVVDVQRRRLATAEEQIAVLGARLAELR